MKTHLGKVNLRSKLLLAFLLVAVLVILTGATGWYGIAEVNSGADEIAQEGDTRYAVATIAAGVEQQESAVRGGLLGDEETQEEWDEGQSRVKEGFEILERVELNDEEARLFDIVMAQHAALVDEYDEFSDALEREDTERAQASAEAISEVEGDMKVAVDQFAAEAEEDTEQAIAANERVTTQALAGIAGVSIGAVIIALVTGVGMTRHIGQPVSAAASSAERIAQGNLTEDMEKTYRTDEIGDLTNSFRSMQAYLQTVAAQASAIANQNFDAAVLDEDVPGELGESIETMQSDIERFVTELEASRASAERAKIDAEELAQGLETQAELMSEAMEQAADGDFTRRLETDLDNDAMESIAVSYNEMVAELEETILHIRQFAAAVDRSSEQANASAAEIKTASEQVSRSIQEIATGAEKQDESVRQVSNEMTNLSATIEEVAASTDEVANKSDEAASIGAEGQKRATEASAEMDAVQEKVRETIDEMQALNDEMDQIGEIVDLIDEIAEQTNMLALNASIEAARAGEAGEGFAVVADEIKGLAEETSDATQDIEELITAVQSSTEQAVADMTEMGSRVTEGAETVDETVDDLEEIVQRVKEANDGIQSINETTEAQASSTEEVVAMVDEVGDISQQNAAQAEDVAAASEEQTSSITEVTNSIEVLAGQAERLRDEMEEFEVGKTESVGEETGTEESVPAVSDDD